MKISIDRDLCQGHAVCMGEAPEVFEVDSDGTMTLKLSNPAPDLQEQVRKAARYCPTESIELEEG